MSLFSSALRPAFRHVVAGAQSVRTIAVPAQSSLFRKNELPPSSFEPSLDNPWWRRTMEIAHEGKTSDPKELRKLGIKPRSVPRKAKHVPAGPPPVKNVMDLLAQKEVSALDPTGSKQKLFAKDNAEAAQVGDILQVRRRNGEPFAGVLLNIRRRGVETAFLLRNELTRVGVEMWFKLYNPLVESVDIVQRAAKRARRAKLYYMRQAKHDRGSVQGIVDQYVRQRAILRGEKHKSR